MSFQGLTKVGQVAVIRPASISRTISLIPSICVLLNARLSAKRAKCLICEANMKAERRDTPITDEHDENTWMKDIDIHPHREWRKAMALARRLERRLNRANAKLAPRKR